MILGTLGACFGGIFVAVANFVRSLSEHDQSGIILNSCLLCGILLMACLFLLNSYKYCIKGNMLNGKIDIHSIRYVEPYSKWEYAPTKETDPQVLHIRYNTYDDLIVSVVNPDEFVADLVAVNPDIEVRK